MTSVHVVHFDGVDIYTTVTKDMEDVKEWIAEADNSLKIKQPKIIGLDTEWTTLGSKNGPENPIAILQLCVEFKCLIYQLNHAKYIPESLITFLNNPEYIFTGVEIKKDFEKLAYKGAIFDTNKATFCRNIKDLRELAMDKGIIPNKEGVGMISLAKKVLNITVEEDETARMGIWHNEILTDPQVKYASIDGYLSFEIGEEMLKMKAKVI